MTGVNAGATDPVHERTLAKLHEQQLVEVDGQSDIMAIGLLYLGPYNVNSILNRSSCTASDPATSSTCTATSRSCGPAA